MGDRTRLPLPRPDGVVRLYVNDGFKDVWTAPSVRDYADAETAALRAELALAKQSAEWNSTVCAQALEDHTMLREKVRLLREGLLGTVRELQACQSVIHLAGGFDPAYVSDAQVALKSARAALEAK